VSCIDLSFSLSLDLGLNRADSTAKSAQPRAIASKTRPVRTFAVASLNGAATSAADNETNGQRSSDNQPNASRRRRLQASKLRELAIVLPQFDKDRCLATSLIKAGGGRCYGVGSLDDAFVRQAATTSQMIHARMRT
jgi:hypothetical protein